DHFNRLAGNVAQDLLHLRRVAVLADIVGRNTLIALGEVVSQLWVSPAAAHAALTVDDNSFQLDVFASDQRCQTPDRSLRIAAWICNQVGRGYSVAVDLRQAIDSLCKMCNVRMAPTVPLSIDIRIAQAIVGAQIDDANPPLQERR